MDYAVLLHFDPTTEARLQTDIDRLVEAGINPTFKAMGMRPHLTITTFSAPDISPVQRVLALAVRKWQPFPIRLASVGLFPVEPGVLFYAPIVDETLLSVHRDLHESMGAYCNEFSPLYQEENWVAHCTLALDLTVPDMMKGIEVLSHGFEPIEAHFSDLTVIACCPYRGIATFPLI